MIPMWMIPVAIACGNTSNIGTCVDIEYFEKTSATLAKVLAGIEKKIRASSEHKKWVAFKGTPLDILGADQVKKLVNDVRMTKGDWSEKDKKHMRAMAVAYAKDLVCAGKLDLKKMKSTAQEMYEFIWDGFTQDLPDDAKGTKEAAKK